MSTKKLEKKRYATLSFDCYGTLIDWENGILGYLQPLFESVDVHVIDSWVLETFAELEPAAQAEGGSYRSVLARVLAAASQVSWPSPPAKKIWPDLRPASSTGNPFRILSKGSRPWVATSS